MNRDELRNNVDTIVVVMMENRSFDHVLGHLRAPQFGNRADVEGIEDEKNQSYFNPNSDGQGVAPFWTGDAAFDSDLPHDPEHVAKQLAYSDFRKKYLMTGFVKAYEDKYHTAVRQPAVMGLLRPEGAPVTTALANHYTVCDHWYSCLPTSTAPNRLMSMCGYTDHRDTGGLLPDQTTVYDWLLDHGVRWRVYSAGLPFFLLMPRIAPLVLTDHFRRLDRIPEDMQTDGGDWPQVIFIEPDYYDCPIHLQDPCDNHPPLAMAAGEAFLKRVYDWFSADSGRWARTVFILTYDEHGGFFDHVSPAPVTYRNPNGVRFDSTGPRTPTIVAGPFAAAAVNKTVLDNTSILQLLAERFGRNGEAYSSEVLGRMQQGIGSVSSVLSAGANNSQRYVLTAPAAATAPAATIPHNQLREGFHQSATTFADRHQAEAFKKYPELRDYLQRRP
jgi:phospholipase C